MNDLDELAQSTAESIGRHIDKDGYQPAWAKVCILAAIDVATKPLQAVVDRLPRDTHGEPITPGARVTYRGEPQTICFVGSETVALQGETVEWWVDAIDCELAKETTHGQS
ncbi:MAG TPA: hypothetical protein VM487_07030 [Phycisphaerae bacterium]|nr:hypothetical protein [Phycisphaerae bacterium]